MKLLPLILTLLVARVGAASADAPYLQLLTPSSVHFDHAPFDVPSPTQRVEIRNGGGATGIEEAELSGPYVIVGKGGSFDPGQTRYWDIACLPSEPYVYGGYLDVRACGETCEDESFTSVYFSCDGGSLAADYHLHWVFAYAYSSGQEAVRFTNATAAPVVVTSLAIGDPTLEATALGAPLPRTLAPGDAIDINVVFHSTGVAETAVNLDVHAGASIVGRVGILAQTRNQLRPVATYIEVPLGATLRVPVVVRNSFPSARTIASVGSDAPAHVVTGLAGTMLAPGASALGGLTVTGDVLGDQQRVLSLAFDGGQGDAQPYGVKVVPATFRLDADDATPHDGAIDFGAQVLGDAPVDRAFTLTNLTATAIAIQGCDPLAAPFAYVGACPTTLPALGSVQIAVRFTPDQLGPAAAAIGLTLADWRYVEGFVSGEVIAPDEPGSGGGSGGGCDHVGSGDDPGCNIGGAGSGMLLALLALRRRRR